MLRFFENFDFEGDNFEKEKKMLKILENFRNFQNFENPSTHIVPVSQQRNVV